MKDKQPRKNFDPRRLVVLGLAVTLLIGGGIGRFFYVGRGDSTVVLTDAAMRIGLVLGGLWLAWDSLRKPARWLPPGIAVAGVVGVAAVAAQPRLLVAVIPAVGLLITLGGVIRLFRGSRK